MVEFAGWEMPVQYSGVIDEHLAVRSRAGLFDDRAGSRRLLARGGVTSESHPATDAGPHLVGNHNPG